jgi:hypothetical protein
VANRLTAADQLDPVSRIPNFKVVPVHVGPVARPIQATDERHQPVLDPFGVASDLHDQPTTARGMA